MPRIFHKSGKRDEIRNFNEFLEICNLKSTVFPRLLLFFYIYNFLEMSDASGSEEKKL